MAGYRAGRKSLPVILTIGGLYVATRKKYRIPDFRVFIPNIGLFSGDRGDMQAIKSKLEGSIQKQFKTSPSPHWELSFKPIYGVKIPVIISLPWDALFLAPIQIRYQIGRNLKIEPKSIGDVLLGYYISAKDVYFYA